MRIWVLQTAFLGDCVLTLPFLHRLLEIQPEAEVTLVATPKTRVIFEMAFARGLRAFSSRVRLLAFDKRGRHAGMRGFQKFRSELGEAPDVAYCLQRSFRTGLLAMLGGARIRVGYSTGAASFLYNVLVRRHWDNGQSEIEKNLDLLRALHPPGRVPKWPSRTAPSLLRSESAPQFEVKPLVVALGSPWASKRWPRENALEFVRQAVAAGLDVHLIGDPTGVKDAAFIREQVPSLLLRDFTGKTDLRAWIDHVAGARLVVSNDSASVHVASDLNVPVVALFGPTLPEFGFAPWRRDSVALGVDGLYCRPCHIHGPKRCPEGHHRCLRELGGQVVFKQVDKMLKSQPT